MVATLVLLATALTGAADSPDAFRAALVRALRAHDDRAVASLFLVSPGVAMLGGQPAGRGTGGLKVWGAYWPDTICAIERGAIHTEGDTLTIGDGTVVAHRVDGEFKVTRFKAVGGPLDKKPRPLATLDLRIRGAKRQAAGNLEFDEVDVYDVDLIKGLVLQATLERFAGNAAVFRVTDAKGNAVNPQADGRRSWTASIPESGTYHVAIVRKAPYCDPLLTYLLTVTAR